MFRCGTNKLHSSGITSLALFYHTFTGIVPMLSLLNQHVRQLVRLDPKSDMPTFKRPPKRVRQVELAESTAKKSIAKKVKSCYNDRAVKLKTKQTRCHRLFTKALTLTKPKAEQCKRSGAARKEFVKDLGINRKEMMQAAFSATRSIYESSCWPPSVFGIMLIALTISWNNNSFRYETGWLRSWKRLQCSFRLVLLLPLSFFGTVDGF
jgi:hypothetical protein